MRIGGDGPGEALPAGWILHGEPRRTYEQDHWRGRETLERWLKPMRDGRRLRVLEIGGNVHPTAAESLHRKLQPI